MKKISEYQTEQSMSMTERALLWCSGADMQLMSLCGFSDRVKFFCLGGIVLATGLLAGCSSGYALYTVFAPTTLNAAGEQPLHWPTAFCALLFGVLWGAIILNLDRYILTSTGKGDGTDQITWDELKSALPRLLLGSIIAITISKPLEIRIFEKEINAHLSVRQGYYLDSLNAITETSFKAKHHALFEQKEVVAKRQQRLQARYDSLQNAYLNETTNSGRPGDGPIAQAIQKQMEMVNVERKAEKTALAALEQQIKEKETEKTNAKLLNEDKAKGLDGLLARIQISHEIGGWITWFVTALFMAIELTPIFFKMMMLKTTYDYHQENLDRILLARQGVSLRKAGGNTPPEASFVHADQQIKEQERLNAAIGNISDELIDKWEKSERARIATNEGSKAEEVADIDNSENQTEVQK